MCVPKLIADAQGLAVFRRQITYTCAKYKATKAFFCVLVFCTGSAVYLARWHVIKSKIGLKLKILRSEAHFLCLKQLNSYKYY